MTTTLSKLVRSFDKQRVFAAALKRRNGGGFNKGINAALPLPAGASLPLQEEPASLCQLALRSLPAPASPSERLLQGRGLDISAPAREIRIGRNGHVKRLSVG